ncbi:general transcription factor 3C polypeptide 2, partial [Nothoprocta perdicaria]|uniref:general transcription factor 3C polypeptide 2 n=1 Tax=Nothoprocta perdicaria TaxID=30464 RepID=UPI000E1BF303
RSKPQCRGLAPNGFHNSVMAPVEKCCSLTGSVRHQNYSQWEFPDWIPLVHKWTCLSESEAAPYLPVEEKSPLFLIQREGIEEDGALSRINRFQSQPPHAERLDVSFFTGGPVWAMEWCPCPAGAAAAAHYVALYCHRSMEETHSAAGLHGGAALLQLWSLGALPGNFVVTAGNDRKIKFWDVRRLYEPINSIKRFLSTEVAWLLPYNGVTVAQDNCYASYGLCGIHYIDAGYLGFKAYFVAPRKGTVWSISGSDWLNTVAAGDITGELVAAVLPDLAINPLNIKRPSERRFPVYKADLLPCGPAGPAGSEQGLPRTRLYSEMVAKTCIRFRDTDLRSFKNFPSREPMRRMHTQEVKAELSLDRLQLEALHKVRFSPNEDSRGWLLSGGQAGIVRLHCLQGLAGSAGRRPLREAPWPPWPHG